MEGARARPAPAPGRSGPSQGGVVLLHKITRMLKRRSFAAAVGASTLASALPARAQFQVDVSGVGARQIPLASASFVGEGTGNAAVSAIVRSDLERVGIFRIIAPGRVLDERAPIPQSELRAAGADAFLAGSMARRSDGNWDVRYALSDVVRGGELLSRSMTVVPDDLRLAAHRIADEIYQKLTGERGVFATRIAYVTKNGPRYALHVTDSDGEGGQIALTSQEPIISPAWSPDGRELAYVSFESRKPVVYVQNVQTGRRQAIANFRGSNSAPAWAPNGRELVVTLSRDGVSQLYQIGRDGGNPRRLTTSNSIDTEACFAPDGRQIYFVSDRGGGPQVYRMPAAGGSAERVTYDGSYNISPTISADGSTLAYITRRGGAFRLAALDLATGAVRVIGDGPQDERPSFAPNGKMLAYAIRQGGRDALVTTTIDGRGRSRPLASGADVREPAWGPYPG